MSVDTPEATVALERFAVEYRDEGIVVRRAVATPDIRQDGDPVTRMVLVLSDPADETWDIDRVRDLRVALGREATTLGLPSVSLTLMAEGGPEAAELLAG